MLSPFCGFPSVGPGRGPLIGALDRNDLRRRIADGLGGIGCDLHGIKVPSTANSFDGIMRGPATTILKFVSFTGSIEGGVSFPEGTVKLIASRVVHQLLGYFDDLAATLVHQ